MLPFNVASHLCCYFSVFFRVLGGLAHHKLHNAFCFSVRNFLLLHFSFFATCKKPRVLSPYFSSRCGVQSNNCNNNLLHFCVAISFCCMQFLVVACNFSFLLQDPRGTPPTSPTTTLSTHTDISSSSSSSKPIGFKRARHEVFLCLLPSRFEKTRLGCFGRSPVWHRLLRKKRSRARKAARVGLATRAQLALLEAHHGSDIPMSPSTWKCRTCSTVNWSMRRTCRLCQYSPERKNNKRDRKKSQDRDSAKPLAAYEDVTDASRARLVATIRHLSRQLSNESMPEDARSSLRFRLQTVKDELYSQDPLPVRVSKMQSAIARAEASFARRKKHCSMPNRSETRRGLTWTN